jgi:hypothetical protein
MNEKEIPNEILMAFARSDAARDGLRDDLKRTKRRLAMHTAARYCIQGDEKLSPNEKAGHAMMHIVCRQIDEVLEVLESVRSLQDPDLKLSQAQADQIAAAIDTVLDRADEAQKEGGSFGVYGFNIGLEGEEAEQALLGMDDMPDFVRKAFGGEE